MKHKKLIIGCSSAFIVFIVLVGVLVGLLYSRFIQPLVGYRTETPAELREPGIIIGSDFLVQEQFFKIAAGKESIGSISDLAIKKSGEGPSSEIVIAGRSGALRIDQNGISTQIQYGFEVAEMKIGVFKTTKSNTMLGDMEIIDLEGDGVFEYLGRGSIDGAAVFDSQGKRLWAYGKFTEENYSVDDMAAGDLDGDGVDEFVVSWRGMELFDRYGALQWRQETEYSASHIDIVDTNGDGTNEIVYSSMGDLIIRGRDGEIVNEVEMPFYVGQFTICYRPGNKQPEILEVEDGHVWLTDFKGRPSAKFEAPLSDLDSATFQTPDGESRGVSVYKSRGSWVKLKKAEPEFLVIITEFAAIDRSVLYIYKASGEIVYQEVLPERCSSMAVLPNPNAGNLQEILIGGEQTIWRYKPR